LFQVITSADNYLRAKKAIFSEKLDLQSTEGPTNLWILKQFKKSFQKSSQNEVKALLCFISNQFFFNRLLKISFVKKKILFV